MNKLILLALSTLTLYSCTIIEVQESDSDKIARENLMVKEPSAYEQKMLVKN